MNQPTVIPDRHRKTSFLARPALWAWGIMLAVSLLPNILAQEVFGLQAGVNLLYVKAGLLALLIAAGFAWPALKQFRPFLVTLLAIYGAEYLFSTQLGRAAWWPTWLGSSAPFAGQMLGIQLRRLAAALAVILTLYLLGLRRTDFFLVRGDLSAPIEPVRWLGFPKTVSWTRFGAQWAVYISLGTLLFLALAGRPAPAALLAAAPLIPVVLLLAAMNAFSEEMTYRASLLGALNGVIQPHHALRLTAVFFGLAHFYGVPYGIIGVVMASFLGWMLGKAMLETRGFFWAWLIHFLQDVAIFTFMAVGAVTPGG